MTITGRLTISVGAFLNTQAAGVQAGSIIIGGTLNNSGTINIRRSASQYADIALNGTSLTGNGTYTTLHDLMDVRNASTSVSVDGSLSIVTVNRIDIEYLFQFVNSCLFFSSFILQNLLYLHYTFP